MVGVVLKRLSMEMSLCFGCWSLISVCRMQLTVVVIVILSGRLRVRPVVIVVDRA